MIILGIDPGTAITGFAVIKKTKDHHEKPKVIDFGCIVTDKSDSPGERLHIIHSQITKIIERHHPAIMSVESLYFFKNLKTVMPISQAKGSILLAAAQKNIPVQEFTPLQVKMTVVGYGRAEKKQVQAMTKELLDFTGIDMSKKHRKKDDASDALGVALCGLLNHNSEHYSSL